MVSQMLSALELARHVVLAILLIACAYTDLARGKIYNMATFPAILAGLFLGYVIGGVHEGGLTGVSLSSSLAAMGLVAVLFGWPYLRGGIAAGDVKLMLAVAAVGALNGFFVVYALLYSTLIGAFMAVLLFIWKGRLAEGIKSAARFALSSGHVSGEDAEGMHKTTGLTIPYGSAIAIGTMIAWFIVEL